MIDRDALMAFLGSDLGVDGDVVNGNNARIADYLNTEQPGGAIVWDDVYVGAFVAAFTGVTLTAEQRAEVDARIAAAAPTDTAVLLHLPTEQIWVASLPRTARDRLGPRTATRAEHEGIADIGSTVSIEDVRWAVRGLDKSYVVAAGQRPKRV